MTDTTRNSVAFTGGSSTMLANSQSVSSPTRHRDFSCLLFCIQGGRHDPFPCTWQCGPHPSGTEHIRIRAGHRRYRRPRDGHERRRVARRDGYCGKRGHEERADHGDQRHRRLSLHAAADWCVHRENRATGVPDDRVEGGAHHGRPLARRRAAAAWNRAGEPRRHRRIPAAADRLIDGQLAHQ